MDMNERANAANDSPAAAFFSDKISRTAAMRADTRTTMTCSVSSITQKLAPGAIHPRVHAVKSW